MPNVPAKKHHISQKNQTLTLHLSSEITNAILNVAKKKPEQKGFWNWLKEYGTSLVTLFTIVSAVVGGLWTLNQYIDQQRQVEISRRQEVIANFTKDLSDPEKRNSAVYALAVLAGEDALPIIRSQLLHNAAYVQDSSYQFAISQSLILVGKPSLPTVLELNRQAASGTPTSQDVQIIEATAPVLEHFLSFEQEFFIGNSNILNGVLLQKMNLAYQNLSGIDFSGAEFNHSDLCRTDFMGASMKDVRFTNSNIGFADFSNTTMLNFRLDSDTAADDVKFDNAQIPKGYFEVANMPYSSWVGASVVGGNFTDAFLERAKFDDANLTDTSFYNAKLFHASFKDANLYNADLSGSDLEGVDFSGANLENVDFISSINQTPGLLVIARSQGKENSGDAFVRGADFDGAIGINGDTRMYLCKWGAINVPGGCTGITVEDMSIVPTDRHTEYSYCQ